MFLSLPLKLQIKNLKFLKFQESPLSHEKSMTYVVPLQTMKINFSGPKIHSTAEESEGYTAGSASPPCFHPGTDFEPTFWSTSYES